MAGFWLTEEPDGLRILSFLNAATPVTLREACTCRKCVDPTDHQRHFVWADIPLNIGLDHSESDGNGGYTIGWRDDIQGYDSQHKSHYSRALILELAEQHTPLIANFGKRPRHLWTASTFNVAENTISYEEYMKDDTALARLLHLVARDGLAFIKGVPGGESSVNKMAKRVGPIRPTFYGETWDVKSMPNPTNVAYTSRYLGFHMDMLYVREPPGLQFLHCIENSCTGGESRFADTFSAADKLISQYGEGFFHVLKSMKVTYHYERPGISTSAVKPIIDTEGHEAKGPNNFTNAENAEFVNKIHRIYWSPPFTGRALRHAKHGRGGNQHLLHQVPASKAFHDILEDKSSYIKMKVPAGTCAVFDNLRVVHAREAFDLNSGNRWLRVAYVDDSDFQSRALTLQHRMPPSNDATG